MLKKVIGYGYETQRFLYIAAAVIVAGWIAISGLMLWGGNDIMRPTKIESNSYAPLNVPVCVFS